MEGNEEDYGIELLFHAVFFEGYPFRKGALTKTFKRYLIEDQKSKYLVDWAEKKRNNREVL